MSYHDNVAGMAEAINRKQAKYERQRTDRNKLQNRFIDLTEQQTQELTDSKTLKASVSNNVPVLAIIPEDKGNINTIEDEYTKIDEMWDGNADQFIINSGATIIRSEITLTDSSGRNRTIVRRGSN